MLYLTAHQNLRKSGFNIQRPYNKCSRIVSISRCFLILSWILDQLFSHRNHSSPAAQKCIFKIRTARRCISTDFLTSMAAIPIGKININSLLLIFIQLSVFVKSVAAPKKDSNTSKETWYVTCSWLHVPQLVFVKILS